MTASDLAFQAQSLTAQLLAFDPTSAGKNGFHAGSTGTPTDDGHANHGARPDEPAPSWEAPDPLPVDDQPEFPVACLPESLGAWAQALATATQTPPALPALTSIGAVSVAAAKRVEIEIRDGWREPVNTYTNVPLDSGNRKTAVIQAVGRPFHDLERTQTAEKAAEIAKARAKRDVVEKRLERLKKEQAANPVNDLALDGEIESTVARLLSDELAVPVAPRYLVDDVTPEKLADLLGEHGERMGVLSAEGGIFQVIAGRYSDGRADGLDLFLKGHSGDPIPIDRVGRPTKHLHAPALTLVVSPQPEVLRGLARIPGFRGRGLLARFAYGVPISKMGRRQVDAAPVPDNVRKTYESLLTAILALPEATTASATNAGNSVDSVYHFPPITVTLGDEAAKAFKAFEQWLEPQLDRDTGELGHIQDWGSKLAGLVARWAALFHVVEHVRPSQSPDGPSTLQERRIRLGTINAVIEIAKTFLIPHAKTAFAMMGADPAERHAHRVLHVVRTHPQEAITRRDMWQRLRKSFSVVEDLDRPIAILVEHGYLRPLASESTKPGRKPSPVFAINPHCHTNAAPASDADPSDDVDTSHVDNQKGKTPETVHTIHRTPDDSHSVDSVYRNGRFASSHEQDLWVPADGEYWTHAGEEGDL